MSGSIIRPYPEGPYVLRGDFALVDEQGEPVELHRRTIALCRCGKSRIKPFCDGAHKAVGRRLSETSSDAEDASSS